MDHAWTFVPADKIAPGGLKKGGQLDTSTAEQSKARSVPLQVMPASSNADSKLPITPWMFPPIGTAAQREKGSFEGKDFLASNCPRQGMLLRLWELRPLTTPAKITCVCFHVGNLPTALPISQTSSVLDESSFLRGSARCCRQTLSLLSEPHMTRCRKTLVSKHFKV